VGEILYQAQAGLAFSYNPSPLTLGAITYLILFVPVVCFGRWVETRFAIYLWPVVRLFSRFEHKTISLR
jgi:ABC-type amino acid transport system permease subunit